MELSLDSSVLKAFNLLKNHGFKGYLVGGSIRDFLIGKESHDLDITTDASKEDILNIFKDYRVIDIGSEYGTVLVIINHIHLEITPHRHESDYKDHRHPTKITYIKDLREDLSRRDFTINAMAYNPDTGLADYFNGQEDLNNKIIRTVNNPDERFNEDALRILRAIRFSLTLGFEIEENTSNAIFNNRDLLKHISIERKISELKKTLATDVYSSFNNYIDIFRTFIDIHTTDKLIDSFKTFEEKLAYILNTDNLSSLKLSNDESSLIKALIHIKDLDFNDDYIFSKTLSSNKHKDIIISFKSVLDNKDYLHKAETLKDRIFDSLDINGYDLMGLGYKNEEIKNQLDLLKNKVNKGEIKNTKELLIEQSRKYI